MDVAAIFIKDDKQTVVPVAAWSDTHFALVVVPDVPNLQRVDSPKAQEAYGEFATLRRIDPMEEVVAGIEHMMEKMRVEVEKERRMNLEEQAKRDDAIARRMKERDAEIDKMHNERNAEIDRKSAERAAEIDRKFDERNAEIDRKLDERMAQQILAQAHTSKPV